MTHYNLVHKFFPVPQAMQILDAKAAVDKKWKKLETIPASNLEKVKSKKEVILQTQRVTENVFFAPLTDICQLKNSELELQSHKYNGRLVLLGGIVKEDFTEKGSSASQMTAAKVMDVIARLPGGDGQAADAVSAHTQVKLEDAPRLLKIPISECSIFGHAFHGTNGPDHGIIEDLVRPLERNLNGHLSAGLLWEKAIRRSFIGTRTGETTE